MKLVARAVTSLALLAFATPALPCGDKAQTTTAAAAPSITAATVAAQKKKESSAVAKSDKEKKANAQKTSGEAKPATASN